MSDYKVKAWSWCADYCKRNQWNPHDSYFWDKAMLQYRRANNIFDVGDKVVFNDDDVYREESSIYKIFEVLDGGEVVLSSDECIDPMIIRHATDAEIKAGERL